MWATEPIPEDDPLRQGDLLESVAFPMMKYPFVVFRVGGGEEQVVVEAKRRWGLVVSQCCDNENNDYVSIAQIQPIGGLTDSQEAALQVREPDPTSLSGYAVSQFLLDPLPDLIPLKPRTHLTVQLLRITTLWGDIAPLTTQRRRRMTPEGRRWLRMNMELLWGRPEDEDMRWLDEHGLPPGF